MESNVNVMNPAAVIVPVAQPTTSPWGNPAASTSPWGTPQQISSTSPTPVSLRDVMSEELARELHHTEVESIEKDGEEERDLGDYLDDPDTSDDLLMAQMLQYEFDREHDRHINSVEKKLNGSSKVAISYENYRMIPPYLDDDSSDEEPLERKDAANINVNFKKGFIGKGKNITTKHDASLCGKKNANKVMEFPPDFETGDVNGDEFELPNHAYNRLKQHSIAEEKRRTKLHEKKEHSTAEHAVDPKTRLLLYKLVNNDILENINGIISTGKESVVFHADGGSSTEAEVPIPKECAIKVFKTTLNEFHTREKYMRGDRRFIRDHQLKCPNPRKLILMWAEKEMMNLLKMQRSGIRCPQPIILRKNILLMSFIGEDRVDAPKLKDARLDQYHWGYAYHQTLQIMKSMYNECQLVHADLSEYNLLWFRGQVWVIDVSQAVDRTHGNALQFLLRDCSNICKFFEKHGVENVPSHYQLFNEITGMNLEGEGEDFLNKIMEYETNEELLTFGLKNKNYSFDYFFDKATEERLAAGKTEEDAPEENIPDTLKNKP